MQIENFDPHEPFFSDPSFEALYSHAGESSPDYDWSEYMQVIEDDQITARVRVHYAALVTMCDASLGRVLDAMDEHDLWADTMLIICTDHGFLLGERGWWGKSVPPWFEETVQTPPFLWNPRRPDRTAPHNPLPTPPGAPGARDARTGDPVTTGSSRPSIWAPPCWSSSACRSLPTCTESPSGPRSGATSPPGRLRCSAHSAGTSRSPTDATSTCEPP